MNAVVVWVLVGVGSVRNGGGDGQLMPSFSFPFGVYSSPEKCEEARKTQQAKISIHLEELKCSLFIQDRAPGGANNVK
jgi:hypothetical protein